MPYLIKNDFSRVITLIDLDKLTNSDDDIWIGAEPSAVEEIKSYMRNRYDVAFEFDYLLHVQADPFLLGDQVIIQTGVDQAHYVAVQDVPGGTVITDTDFWLKRDARNPKIVTIAILVLLYENYTRINGTEIPNWLQLRYDGGDVRQTGGAIGYLKNIQRGLVETSTPLLPAVADGTDQTGNNIAFGVAEELVARNTSI